MTKDQLLGKLGLGKDVPVTAQHLTEAFPDVIGGIVNTAHAAGLESVDKITIGKAAVTTAMEGIMALAIAFFGQANGDKFKALVAFGVTPDQIKALGLAPEAPAAIETEEEKKMKAAILAGLKGSGADNPGAGDGKQIGSKDFMALVAAYQAEHKCSRLDAIKATANAHPEVHESYIKLVNTKKK